MHVELWTDGSGTTPGNPGGWAYVLRAIDDNGEIVKQVEGSGSEYDTTNNRMEMTALLMGLRALTRPTRVLVRTDSEYVMHAWTQDWIGKWERRGWRKVKNVDLWHALVNEATRHTLTFKHVRGHTGVELNERCDKLAGEARRRAIEELADRDAGMVVDQLELAHG